jgi:hypothetical protein
LEDPGVCGRILLKRTFKKLNGRGGGMEWTDNTGNRDRWRAVVRGGNEPLGSIIWGEFRD